MKHRAVFVAIFGAAILAVAPIAGGTTTGGVGSIVPTITISGNGLTPLVLKTSELSLLPQQTITVKIDGTATTESGPLVSAVLAYAGLNYISACKNDDLRYWVQASGSDGNAAEVSAGEIDAGFGNNLAILSIIQNGKFLTSSGPRLIVPNDATSLRDIQHVSKLTVGRAPTELAETTAACNPPSFVPPIATPPAGSVVINGDVAKPMTLTYTQLAALPQVTQQTSFLQGTAPKGNVETGPTLYSVLAAAEPKFLSCSKNDKLRFYVEVTSSEDGNANLVSWAEIDPSMNNNQVLLGLIEDGHSTLTTDTGPRLTVPGDVKGGRYNFGSAVITVFRAPTAVPIPSCRTKKA